MSPAPRVSTRIVEAVVDELDHDPLTLPPLQDDVDGDALDVLFATASTPPELTLAYAGCRVRVDASGVDVEQESARRESTCPSRT
ncbi:MULTISPECIES: HalOD1 output domain-containing protein [Halomarina]|uniref:HalOD1 output domain-containing protein n=1 Tax=Halomarina rubra TaxID=2071873 RepID=A0ABD6AY82_9EURY|nr:HalOD1 output domain-containing protein [Halomarina rubra]